MKNLLNAFRSQTARHIISLLILTSLTLISCQGESLLNSVFTSQSSGSVESELTSSASGDNELDATTTPSYLVPDELVVWVPPQFDPSEDSESGRLLNARIEAYQRENPHINLVVRVKAAAGSGSALETMTHASAVAADALPALVLLSRGDMVQAVSRNLILPIENLSTAIDEDDWYDFSRQMGIFQGTTYSLPFASNILVMVHRPGLLESDQPGWDEVMRRFDQLVFPAADPEALVTLSLYLSTGGVIQDSQGHPMINSEELVKILSFYDDANRRGLLPEGLEEIQTDDQAWELFLESSGGAIITWASRQLLDERDYRLTLLPTFGDENYSTATGWVWCLAAVKENDQLEAIRLAEFLVTPDFLKDWSQLSGFLPVRPSSLDAWGDTNQKNTIQKMLLAARLRPNRDQISIIAPELKNAVLEIIFMQSTPVESAQKLLERLEAIET